MLCCYSYAGIRLGAMSTALQLPGRLLLRCRGASTTAVLSHPSCCTTVEAAARFSSSSSAAPSTAYSSGDDHGRPGNGVVGMRRETKNRWERRAPITPKTCARLRRNGIRVLVQPSSMRFFPDDAYRAAGAEVMEDIAEASVIVGVKEVPVPELIPDRTYLCFSHTIKAQESNMGMLDAMRGLRIRLIDYECMTDEQGRRVIGFGKFAGHAGMIDLLRGLGDRLLGLGHSNPFLGMGYSDYYHSLAAARSAIQLVAHNILINGLPQPLASPAVFAFTGTGQVAQGAWEIFEELPVEWIVP